MFKTTFQKEEPKIPPKKLKYCDFKKFTFTNIQSVLTSKLNSLDSNEYYTFENIS